MTYQNLSPVKMNSTRRLMNDLGTVNVYAEVRGKYARMPILNPSQKAGIVSRPATSGSLIKYSRGSHERHRSLPVSIVEDEEEIRRPLAQEFATPKRSLVQKEIKSANSPRKIENSLPELDKSPKLPVVFEERPKHVDDPESETESEEAEVSTEFSFKTTSSQKKYIEELEQMLREERLVILNIETYQA